MTVVSFVVLAFAQGPEPAREFVLDTGVVRRTIRYGGPANQRFDDLFHRSAIDNPKAAPPKAEKVHLSPKLAVETVVVDGEYRLVIRDGSTTTEYWGRLGDHFIRTRVTAANPESADQLDVDSFPAFGQASGGGLGMPIFFGEDWFCGIEQPAGVNKVEIRKDNRPYVRMFHHPGAGAKSSFTAVIGTRGPKDKTILDAFERYLESVKRPVTPWLVYNSWYDKRGTDLTPAALAKTFGEFDKRLLKPHNAAFDAFVVDDGWQEPKSVWEPNAVWKSGFAQLTEPLKMQRSKLGIWLPLNGLSLNTGWGAGQGYARSNHRKQYYCLDDPKYNEALRSSIGSLVRNRDVHFFKHDFNFLECSDPSHAHGGSPETGREANVVAQMELLAYERSIKSDIGLAVTSNAWPSPWWLTQADFLWIGSYDYAENWRVPCWSKRQAEVTFRDTVIHRLLKIDRTPVPMSAFMTHGLIRGHYEGNDADREHDWWDYVAMQFGRGTMLHELYISPELLSDAELQAVGKAVKWAKANAETLKHTRMIGGNPDLGEPYGYIHWSEKKGIACLRNPSPMPKTIELTTDERPGQLSNWDTYFLSEIYPSEVAIADGKGDLKCSIRLHGHEVKIVEILPERSPMPRSVDGDRAILVQTDATSDRLFWNWNGVAVGRHCDGADIVVATYPASGVWTHGMRTEYVAAPDKSWSLSRYEQQFLKFRTFEIANAYARLDLPFSPFWPAETKASVSMHLHERFSRGQTESASRKLEAGAREWKAEYLLLDNWTFFRHRSKIEVWAWLLVLGVLPILSAIWLQRRIAARWKRPRTTALLLIVATTALYAVTPVGSALARILTEL